MLVSRMAYQGLKAKPDGIGIRDCSAGYPRLFEEFVINVEGFLHTCNSATKVWLLELLEKNQRCAVRNRCVVLLAPRSW